jgi:hypothetical protein
MLETSGKECFNEKLTAFAAAQDEAKEQGLSWRDGLFFSLFAVSLIGSNGLRKVGGLLTRFYKSGVNVATQMATYFKTAFSNGGRFASLFGKQKIKVVSSSLSRVSSRMAMTFGKIRQSVSASTIAKGRRIPFPRAGRLFGALNWILMAASVGELLWMAFATDDPDNEAGSEEGNRFLDASMDTIDNDYLYAVNAEYPPLNPNSPEIWKMLHDLQASLDVEKYKDPNLRERATNALKYFVTVIGNMEDDETSARKLGWSLVGAGSSMAAGIPFMLSTNQATLNLDPENEGTHLALLALNGELGRCAGLVTSEDQKELEGLGISDADGSFMNTLDQRAHLTRLALLSR